MSGPACIDTTQPNVQIVVDFSSPVTGFLASELQAVGLTPTGITTTDNMRYTVSCNLAGLPYGISNRRTAVLQGPGGLTQIVQNATTKPSYSPGDERAHPITLPFPIAFPTSSTTIVSGNKIWVTTNSGIYLSETDKESGHPVKPDNPLAPGIFIGARDAGLFNLYAGAENGDTSYRIRWEGVDLWSKGETISALNIIWEITFYKSDPTRFSIDISDKWVPGGSSIIKNVNTELYNIAAEVAANKGFDVSFAYQAQVLAGAAQSSTGNGNTISNLFSRLPCTVNATSI